MIEIENNILNDKWYLFFDTNTEEAYNLIKKEIASPDIKVRIREMARRYHSANHGTVCIGVFKGDEAKADGEQLSLQTEPEVLRQQEHPSYSS